MSEYREALQRLTNCCDRREVMELQKYYAEEEFLGDESQISQDHCLYKQKDVDAVFAEIKQQHADFVLRLQAEHAEEISGLRKQVDDLICAERDLIALGALAKDEYKRDADMLIRQHAEEIESIRKQWDDEQWRIQKLEAEAIELRKQAERYEKLRVMNAPDFASIRRMAFRDTEMPMLMAFDALVDQLPASGEK